MEKDNLKSSFHTFFNKINNILTAASLNKIILEGKDINRFSIEESREIIFEMSESISMIEKNAVVLNTTLRELYSALLQELDSAVSNPPSAGQ